jgi:hypothetical protein
MSGDIIILEENGQEIEVVIKDITSRERVKYSKWLRSQFPSLVNNRNDFKVTPKFIEFWQNLLPKMTSIDGMSLYSFSMSSFNQLVHACANRIAGKDIDTGRDDITVFKEDSSEYDDTTMIDSTKSIEDAGKNMSLDFDLNEDGAVDLDDWQ